MDKQTIGVVGAGVMGVGVAQNLAQTGYKVLLLDLTTVVDTLNVLYQSYQDPKFRCCPLLQRMVDAGLLGVKSGKGFYSY